jgi:phage terminase large subunit GpA-like protein
VTAATLAEASCYTTAFRAGLRPDPMQTVDEWADQHVQLPSYVAESGQWRTSRTPFLREIMQCLSPSHPCHEVVFMKCVQIGGTQVAVNWCGYVIDRAPAAMIFAEPTMDVAKKVSKQKVQPMLDVTPSLKGKVKESRSRDSGNTVLSKEFLGGFLVFIGANSGIGLRFTSAPFVVADEIDAYPQDLDGEGHPCDLLKNRMATFARWKFFKLSTPLEAESSRIEPDYEAGSRGRYHVPCPFCGQLQELQWGQLVFTFDGVHDPDRAAYRCAACLAMIPERYKGQMLEQGRWVHEDPDNPVRSFRINALYVPYGWLLSWAELSRQWLVATEAAKSGDMRKLKEFVNTKLAETWEEKGETADQSELYQRREQYEAACPDGVLVLTAAVDVQDNRLEVEIDGWGVEEENWSIEKRVFPGSPGQPTVWKDLTDWLQRKWLHASGIALRVECVVVDTGGHHTKEAYWFVRRYRGRCYALKGSNQQGAPLVPPRPTRPRGAAVHLYHVGTVAAKDTLFSRLKLTEPGPGYMHFPDRPEYDEEHFAQLASEEKRNKYDRGVMTGYFYKKIRARNEALDLKVYNLAAVALLNPHWEKLAAKMVKPAQIEIATEDEDQQPVAVGVAPSAPERPLAAQSSKPQQPRRRAGGFVKGWR